MLISLVIGTRNRVDKLTNCLDAVAAATRPDCAVEVIVADNGSTDSTRQVVEDFITRSPVEARYVYSPGPRISVARNAAIAAAAGVWVAFTDDDCYLDRDYFVAFHRFTRSLHKNAAAGAPIAYGGGQIHFFDASHDTRIAARYFEDFWEIPRNSLLAASALQGANMFFRRKVLETIGGFDEDLGPGTPFIDEDIELACRASRAGFAGAQVPTLKVYHDHGRPPGSAEADAALEAYDYGRGAYYAGLLDQGLLGAWQLWASACSLEDNPAPELRERLAREFEGAARYLRFKLAERDKHDAAPGHWKTG
jgi:glycosyltransferase involved in cell wall biosynthesis